ncbi:MAG: hypothetical protein WC449_03600 [Candidatus Paceibacterota bacterium]
MDTSFLKDEKNWVILMALIIGAVLLFFQAGYKKYTKVEVKQFATSSIDLNALRMPKMEPIFPYDEIAIPPAQSTMDESLRSALNLGNDNPFYIGKISASKAPTTTKRAGKTVTVPEP